MNPQNSQPDNPNLQKLEDDVQKLAQEAKEQVQPQTPAQAVTPETPVVPAPPPMASNPVPEAPMTPEPVQVAPKGRSPLITIAIVLVVVAVLAAVAYFAGSKYLNMNSKVQSPVPTAQALPVFTPEAGPPVVSPPFGPEGAAVTEEMASPSASPTSTSVATPSATPQL